MKEAERSIKIKIFVCETCGAEHTEEWHGKWAVFHCPEHGEFCNSGGNECGLFRWSEERRGDTCSCPICGWCVLAYEDYCEVYDNREGKKPETEKEIESFNYHKNLVLSNPNCYRGSSAYDRIVGGSK